MRIFAYCLLVALVSVEVFGKEKPKYPVSAIPEDLQKDVVAVVREDDMVFTITRDNRASLHCHFVVTILNPKGNYFGEHSEWYSKLRKITKFEGRVYNDQGLLIKELKSNDIIDRSAYGDGSLHTDTRIKSASLTHNNYPYTIEFEYDIEYKFLYHIDGSYIVSTEKVSVQNASYKLVYPKSLKPRYKTYNIDQQPIILALADERESVTWNFENMKAIKFEPLSDRSAILPHIVAAPGKFDYDGYRGSMETWEEYGQWQLSLNQGRDVLSEWTKNKIWELTKGLATDEEKVKALYEYMQNKTRYVNISLGIGGLQPFEAMVVDQVGYGDCKGLSNYMVAMLKAVGIKGYYCKVMAGENAPKIDVGFPSHQTNHIIVAVPNSADTLWLECTSQTNPFDYLGTFTGDRKALMVTDAGGKIVNTHRYNIDQNTQVRSADVTIQLSGDAKAKIKTVYSGLQYENDNLNFILNQSYDDQKKWIMANTSIPAFDIVQFSMHNRKNKIPTAVVNLDLTLKRWATVTGKRIFITPNLMNRSSFVPPKLETRKTNVVWPMAHIDTDTIRYHLPDGIYPEFLPSPIVIKSRFGQYDASYEVRENELLYVRKLRMNKGEFPPESYIEILDFLRNINKADNTKIVFMSKT